MNRLEKAAGFGSMMGKQAGLFWKKLDQPVGIKSQWGPHNGVTEMRLDAERTMEPRLLTRLFSSPEKDYDHLFSVMKDMAEQGSETTSTAMGRAMLASHLLPKWYPGRYKQEGDSPIGNEDVFEDSVYPAFSSQIKAAPTTPMTAKKASDALKAASCWTGYERVPGTAALTEGSCRPVGKKKKDSEKKASEAWQTSEGKNPDGGLNEKGRASLKAKGQDIKRPQPEGGARKDSFCARMGGMKSKLTSEATANDPDSRINKALRKWKC